jgi:4-aminobutyrate aminotransferase and related aminotransferases
VPDIVCLSKSLSGYGLPFAITLLKPELDVWEPGEHNGTFRGPNPAFVTATAAMDFWTGEGMEKETLTKGDQIEEALNRIASSHADAIDGVRGRGLAQGLAFADAEAASAVCAQAFDRRLLMETSGPESEVVKLLPPLTTTADELAEGLDIIAASIDAVLV